MDFDCDVVVIGSGFGGAVMTCRLVEKKYKVILLERGRQYRMYEFPRKMSEVKTRFFWDPNKQQYGVMEVSDYAESDLMAVTASGLGGGSLIYANVLMKMPQEYFIGWPGKLSLKTLDPYYQKVLQTMEASPYPQDDPYYKETPKTQIFKEVFERIKNSEEKDYAKKPQFIYPHLSVWFKGTFPGEQSLNTHGAVQAKCIKCSECNIGCNIHAKNSLDLNYLFRAKELGADIRTYAQVEEIIPFEDESGYFVVYVDPRNKNDKTILKAKKVILSAGTLGSNKLLLKMKKEGKLNQLSPMLGKKWSGNGDLEGMATKTLKESHPSEGPVITSAIHYSYKPYEDGFYYGLFIQDAAYPSAIAWPIVGKTLPPQSTLALIRFASRMIKNLMVRILNLSEVTGPVNIGGHLSGLIDDDLYFRKFFPILGMGRERSSGQAMLRNDGELTIKWDLAPNKSHFKRVRHEMKKISKVLNAKFMDNPLTHLDKVIAVHPLGGCVMGDSKETGVVNCHGEVFGHLGLYVVDGSILPTSTGPNPSLTIAALAEFIAEQF